MAGILAGKLQICYNPVSDEAEKTGLPEKLFPCPAVVKTT
jgi:hypothetical protein